MSAQVCRFTSGPRSCLVANIERRSLADIDIWGPVQRCAVSVSVCPADDCPANLLFVVVIFVATLRVGEAGGVENEMS